ncbi:MAG: hypothetical protein DPW13_11900 [Planctomycetes bacterium]|nr:hypothetical protein [Planctomycetota bacterium]
MSQTLALIAIDFQQVYEEHRTAENMAHSMLKISLSLLALPLLALGALLAAGRIDPKADLSLMSLPQPVALLMIFTAILDIVPLFYVIENHTNETNCKHAINGFRSLYVQLKASTSQPILLAWQPLLSVDTTLPSSSSLLSSGHILFCALAFFNSLYMAAGVVSYDVGHWATLLFILIVSFILHYLAYFLYAKQVMVPKTSESGNARTQ